MRLPQALLSLIVVILAAGTQASIAQDKPYREGTVWSVSFIKVKPGMLDAYLRDLAVARNNVMGEAKRQGLIVSERFCPAMQSAATTGI